MGKKQEEEKAQQVVKPAPIATIKLDDWENHPERHGAMFDLSASEDVELSKGETKVIPLGIRMKLPEGCFGLVVPRSSACLKHGIMMANSVGIIEPDYCGNGDVWGFVAYAIRGTKVKKGTRIAQFMPVRMFGDLDFEVVDSMPDPDRGGYGSTGDMSNGGEPMFLDANGKELHVGDNVVDTAVLDRGRVVETYTTHDGIAVARVDFGNTGNGNLIRCECLELDDRPLDFDGVPIEVGDVLYEVDHLGEHLSSNGITAEGRCHDGTVSVSTSIGSGFCNPSRLTHREPDSFERIAKDSFMPSFSYCIEHGLSLDTGTTNMRDDLVRRMKAVAARGER